MTEEIKIFTPAQTIMKKVSKLLNFETSSASKILRHQKMNTKRDTFATVTEITKVIRKNIVAKTLHPMIGMSITMKQLVTNRRRWQNNWNDDDLKDDERTTGVCFLTKKITKIKIFSTMQINDTDKIILPSTSLCFISRCITFIHFQRYLFSLVLIRNFWYLNLPWVSFTWYSRQETHFGSKTREAIWWAVRIHKCKCYRAVLLIFKNEPLREDHSNKILSDLLLSTVFGGIINIVKIVFYNSFFIEFYWLFVQIFKTRFP